MKTILLAYVALAAILIAGIYYQQPIHLALVSAEYGCYPWSKKEVPYREGMTLCPGQTTGIQITLSGGTKASDISISATKEPVTIRGSEK